MNKEYEKLFTALEKVKQERKRICTHAIIDDILLLFLDDIATKKVKKIDKINKLAKKISEKIETDIPFNYG